MKSLNRFALISIIFILFTSFAGAQIIVVKKPVRQKVVVVKRVKPAKNYIWKSGDWVVRNGKYVWLEGDLVRIKSGHKWVSGQWNKVPTGWKWIPGHWKVVR